VGYFYGSSRVCRANGDSISLYEAIYIIRIDLPMLVRKEKGKRFLGRSAKFLIEYQRIRVRSYWSHMSASGSGERFHPHFTSLPL